MRKGPESATAANARLPCPWDEVIATRIITCSWDEVIATRIIRSLSRTCRLLHNIHFSNVTRSFAFYINFLLSSKYVWLNLQNQVQTNQWYVYQHYIY